MSNSIKKMIMHQDLIMAVENYNHTQNESLLPEIFLQIKQYIAQSDMRRMQLKCAFSPASTLEQVLTALEMLPSATEYYLMGCCLLALSKQRNWDVSEILTAMKINCNGCISSLCEEHKDFIGRIALHQAASFLTKEQLIQVIQLLDGYYIRQDILNRIADCDEPPAISLLRKRLLGRQPGAFYPPPSAIPSRYRNIDKEAAFTLFEKEMLACETFSSAPTGILPEAAILRDKIPDTQMLNLFALLEEEDLSSGHAIMVLLKKISQPLNADLSEYKNGSELLTTAQQNMLNCQYPEDIFLSFVEYRPDCLDDWFAEAWKVLCSIGQSDTFLNNTEDNRDFFHIWRELKDNADERNVRLECYLVKFLRIAIAHGTPEQISKILSLLTPGEIARHISRLSTVEISLLYSIFQENSFSYFALHTVISSMDWSKLSFDEMAKIIPCMLNDKRFLTKFLEKKSWR